jgi:hypothetical protein
VLLLRALHITVRAFLVLASAFWMLISLELLPVLAYSGMDGVRAKLLHIWSMGKLDLTFPWICQDSLLLVHQGYTDIILFLLLTWAGVELKRFLHRRMVQSGRLAQIPADTR